MKIIILKIESYVPPLDPLWGGGCINVINVQQTVTELPLDNMFKLLLIFLLVLCRSYIFDITGSNSWQVYSTEWEHLIKEPGDLY